MSLRTGRGYSFPLVFTPRARTGEGWEPLPFFQRGE